MGKDAPGQNCRYVSRFTTYDRFFLTPRNLGSVGVLGRNFVRATASFDSQLPFPPIAV